MRRNVFQYLKSYSSDVTKVNRLLVSSFIKINDIEVVNNQLVKIYIIEKNDSDYSHFIDFCELFEKRFDLENLIELFEFVISPKDKLVNGAVYTPMNVRSFIIQNIYSRNKIGKESKIGDISCGCGGFLVDVAILINKDYGISFREIYEDNIYGLDIKDYSIERTKILMSLVALFNGEDVERFNFNLFVGNALNFEWETKFDVILGNPPYVCSRNIDDESKQYVQNWSVCSTGHPDLYIPFFQIALESLTNNGVMGYITVNSFLKSINGRALRDYFISRKNDFEITDFGGEQIFHSRSTYTCICVIQNTHSEFVKYRKIESSNLNREKTHFTSRRYEELSEDGWSFNSVDIIEKIENTGQPFGKKFKTRNGIATLKNGVYIFRPSKTDNKFFYIESDGGIFPIEKDICRNVINPNKLTSSADIDALKQKIIFPYQYVDGSSQPVLIAEDDLRKSYPNAYCYLSRQKKLLSERDKGNGKYGAWYAYGRNQSLERMKFKLFFPHITSGTPNFVLTDEELLFYNGLAVISEDEESLKVLRILMSSRVFWFYIVNTSKPYSSGYFSLSRNYIKNFGICEFTQDEIDFLLEEKDEALLNNFIEKKYDIELTD